jgi:two-component system chemotaxis response regulator CheY
MIKILIVDDSVFSQKVAAGFMKKHLEDAEIYFANDGLEGIEKYIEIKPDYVFLDLLMPKVNGRELIKLIKEYDSAAKIFVVSADVQKNVREEIEACGVKSFINKPFNEEKVQLVCEMLKEDKDE